MPKAVQRDPLKNNLDKLATKLVEKALNDPEATVRTLSDALKVAGAFYHMSRKPTGDEASAPNDAWVGYTNSFMGAAGDGKAN